MTRAPFVTGKSEAAFQRTTEIYDTTIGWRFINPVLKAQYGVDSMPETGENVAQEFQVTREEQDAFALRSQERAARAQADGTFGEPHRADRDPGPEGPGAGRPRRAPARRHDAGTLVEAEADRTPGRDGHGRQRLRRQRRRRRPDPRLRRRRRSRHGLTPLARVLGLASAGVPPRIMGIGPVPAVGKLVERLGVKVSDVFEVIELNEAFASQAVACLRQLGVADDAEHVNPNGGAIALGHPLGMSGDPHRRRCRARALAPRRQASASPPCASASGRASRSRSSGSDPALPGRRRQGRGYWIFGGWLMSKPGRPGRPPPGESRPGIWSWSSFCCTAFGSI